MISGARHARMRATEAVESGPNSPRSNRRRARGVPNTRQPEERDLGEREDGQVLGVAEDHGSEPQPGDVTGGKIGREGVIDKEVDLSEVGADADRQKILPHSAAALGCGPGRLQPEPRRVL